MTDGDRALIRISGVLASGDEVALADTLSHAREVAEVAEVLLQSYLFLGFPVSINGIAAWRRLTSRDPSGPEKLEYPLWEERGYEVCGAVYTGHYERLRESVRALHPDLEQWMVAEGYGKVLGRPGLALVTRELCIVATLAVTGASKQLYSHLLGALDVGALPEDVDTALAEVEPFLDGENRRVVAAPWERYSG